MAKLYREIGKRVFAICDKQDAANKALIEAQVDVLLMYDEKGFEDLVLKNTTEEALRRFAKLIDWPPHLTTKYPDVEAAAPAAISELLPLDEGQLGHRRLSRPVQRAGDTEVASGGLHSIEDRLYGRSRFGCRTGSRYGCN